jgi:hypothetical protein
MKKQYIVMNGFEFKEKTYYVVEIAMNMNNPIFQDIFHTGFLNGKNGMPGGYNGFFQADGEFKDITYMKVISELDTKIDNEYSMVRDVLTKQYPEKLI